MTAIAMDHRESRIHPKKFALLLAIGSMTMFFAAFTSAYVVKRLGGDWEPFVLPGVFQTSTFVIMASSLTLFLAHRALRREHAFLYKAFLGATLGLGLLFVFLQFQGWKDLKAIGVYLDGNPSGSFLYVITGAHFVHVAGGILFILFVFLYALFRYRGPADSLIYETQPANKLRMDMLSMYWHFVDILWVYLFIFFYANHQ